MRRGLLHGKVAAVAAAALVGVLGAAAVFSGGPPAVHAAPAALAGTFNECGNSGIPDAVASGNGFECDIFTTQPIPVTTGSTPGLTITLDSPAGSAFFTTTTLPATCAVVSSTSTEADIQCTSGAGIGSEIGLGIVGGANGAIGMTATYAPAGTPVKSKLSFNYQLDASGHEGKASVVTNGNLDAGPIQTTCTNTTAGKQPGDPVAVGDTFDCVVAFNNLVTPGHAVITPDAGMNIGGFTVSGEDTSGLPGNLKGYSCGSGPSNTTCIGYTIHGTATAAGQVVFDQDYYALGSDTPTTQHDVNTHYFIVAKTTTTLTFSKNPVTVNNPTTLTATVTPSTGCTLGADSVQFSVDGNKVGSPVPVSNGKATLDYTPTIVGDHTVTATYSGNANCGTSSDTKTLTVRKAGTSTSLLITTTGGTPVTNVPANTTVELTAAIVPAAGCTLTTADASQVVFTDGFTALSGLTPVNTTVNTSDGALIIAEDFTTTNAGPYHFEVFFEGTANCDLSNSPLMTLNANSSKPSLALAATPSAPNYVAKTLTLTASLGSFNNCTPDTGVNGDTIQFFANGNLISSQQVVNANITKYQTTFTPNAAGPYHFEVDYVPGANNFDCQGNSATTDVTITQAGTTTQLLQTQGAATVSPGTPVQYEAIVSAQTGCVLTFNNQPNPDSVTFTVTDSNNNVVLIQIATLTDNGSGSAGDAFLNWTPQNAGKYTVSVAYDNSANCGTSSGTPLKLTVGATPTQLALTSSNNPVKVNHPTTYTATITPNFPGCTFQGLTDPAPVFQYDGQTIPGTVSGPIITANSETWTISYSPAGSGNHTVTATWAGNATCDGSSNTLQQSVTIGQATISVKTAPNASTGNQSVTITATVSGDLANSGCVLNDGGVPQVITFKWNGATVGTKALSPGASSDPGTETAAFTYTPTTATSAAGVTVEADYPADGSCAANSATTNQVVNLAADTVLLSGPTPANPTVNNPVTFTAEVDAGQYCVLTSADKIDLVVNGQTVYTTTLASGTFGPSSTANIPLTYTPTAAGTNLPVHAHYEGNSLCAANDSTTTTISVTVNKAAPTVNVASSANPSAGAAPITFTATLNPLNGCVPVSGDTVQFTYNGSNIGTPVALNINNNTAISASFTPTQPTTAAGVVVTAIYLPANSNATCATATGTLSQNQVVNAGATNTTLKLSTAPSNPVANQAFSVTATVAPAAANNGCVPSTADQVSFVVDGGTAQLFNLNGSNQATLPIAGLPLGPHTISATYLPANSNPFCLGSSTGAVAVTVGAAPAAAPGVALTSPTSAVDNGEGIQLIATVTANGGCTPSNADTVTFSYTSTSGAFASGVIPLGAGNTASLTTAAGNALPTGTTTITINYTANTAGCSSTSGTGTVTVNAAAANAVTGTNFNFIRNVAVSNQQLAKISDPSCTAGTTYTVTIDWGDGSAPTTNSNVTSASLGGCNNLNVTGTHTYTAAGKKTVKVTVTGSDLFSGSVNDTATDVTPNTSGGGSSGGGYVPALPYNGQGYQPIPYPFGPA